MAKCKALTGSAVKGLTQLHQNAVVSLKTVGFYVKLLQK